MYNLHLDSIYQSAQSADMHGRVTDHEAGLGPICIDTANSPRLFSIGKKPLPSHADAKRVFWPICLSQQGALGPSVGVWGLGYDHTTMYGV